MRDTIYEHRGKSRESDLESVTRMDCEDWPTLEVESPQNPRDLRVNVRKLQHLPGLPLDSLGSTGQPGSTSDFSFQQRVATKHWRTVRAQLKAHTFILGLQKKQQAKESEKEEEGDEEGEYYNIHSSSEQSSPKSPNAAGWTQNPHVQLLQSQLEEATEEIERLYTEKEDVEHLLHEVRRNSSRSSIRLEHIPTPMSPERVSVACQCEEMPPSVPSPMGRRAFSKTPVSPLSPEVDDEERLDRRDLLEFERRLFLEDAAAWEIERTELEDKQAQLEGEVANALREAEEAAERGDPAVPRKNGQRKTCSQNAVVNVILVTLEAKLLQSPPFSIFATSSDARSP